MIKAFLLILNLKSPISKYAGLSSRETLMLAYIHPGKGGGGYIGMAWGGLFIAYMVFGDTKI